MFEGRMRTDRHEGSILLDLKGVRAQIGMRDGVPGVRNGLSCACFRSVCA